MILTTQTKDFICFGASLIDTAVENQIIKSGMCYYGRGVAKKVKLYDRFDNYIGRYHVPTELSGKLIHGFCASATLVKVAAE